jgi:polysaccharide pyruvyl transferase WcaK-like protein
MGCTVHVLIEPGSYTGANIGDVSMLAVALQRLRRTWPGAEVKVHGSDRDSLAAIDAEAELLDPYGSVAWSYVHSPLLARIALMARRRRPGAVRDYLDAVRAADLVLVSGGGFMNDVFRRHALIVLDTLEMAIESGAVTALVGQGLGPITDRPLRRRIAEVLPRVDLITLREGVAGPQLLASIGVPSDRVCVTGDDAVALAYAARHETIGSTLGVNLRVASYSGFTEDDVELVGRTLREHGAPLTPILISTEDCAPVGRIVRQSIGMPRTVSDAIDVLPGCRVVVTSSYHAAVFALSMGIPAVALARSAYYIAKFRGLASQFRFACRVVRSSGQELRDAIDDAWSGAVEARPNLLDAARRQIALGEAAFAVLPQKVAESHE